MPCPGLLMPLYRFYAPRRLWHLRLTGVTAGRLTETEATPTYVAFSMHGYSCEFCD
jgi:hypothetical protein